MKTTILCLALLALFSNTINAADCSNPLLSTYGFTGLGTAATGTGFSYCKSLKGNPACCDATLVNSFQSKADALTTNLTKLVTTRDKALVDTRDNDIPGMQDALSQLTELSQSLSSLGNLGSSLSFGSVEGSLTTLVESLDSLRDSFQTYQQNRTTCVKEIVGLQAAGWCLACDPDYATKGITGSTLTIGSTACTRLGAACYDYVVGSVAQSSLLALRSSAKLLTKMIEVLDKLQSGDTSAMTEFTTLLTNQAKPVDAEKQVTLPSSCTKDGCPWICTNFFKNGVVDQSILANGGVFTKTDSLVSGGSGGVRLLQAAANEWNPAADEAGVTVNFSDDPGNVGHSMIMKGGLVCVLGMLMALFM